MEPARIRLRLTADGRVSRDTLAEIRNYFLQQVTERMEDPIEQLQVDILKARLEPGDKILLKETFVVAIVA